MDVEGRVARAARGSAEVLTPEGLRAVFETHERPRAYIGFEPSGPLTAGHLVCARKMRDLQEAGCDLTVLLADWHAWINDKLGGSMERIHAAGEAMRATFGALGVDPGRVTYRWASDLAAQDGYWARVVRVAKATSLARTRRAMTILGRSEEEAQLDTAKLFYPAMQAADIFELPVEIAYAGLDQRRAHMLAREVAHHYGWPVPVAIHTPIIPALSGGGRMDATADGPARKMSKSDPAGAIPIPTTGPEVAARIRSAFCEARSVEGNPVVDLARYVLLPWDGAFVLERTPPHGGDLTFTDEEAFLAAWRVGAIHPADLKAAVARGLSAILVPASERLRSLGGAASAAPSDDDPGAPGRASEGDRPRAGDAARAGGPVREGAVRPER